MQTGKGKNKGTEFERFICRKLSLFVTSGRNETVFWRSAISGGRATRQMKKGVINQAQSGDICAVATEGHLWCDFFYFELKFYKDLQVDSSLIKSSGMLFSFWNTTVQESAKYGKVPVLIAKQNLLPILMIIGDHTSGPPFAGDPIIYLHRWNASVRLFDDAIKYTVNRVRRKDLV